LDFTVGWFGRERETGGNEEWELERERESEQASAGLCGLADCRYKLFQSFRAFIYFSIISVLLSEIPGQLGA